jgi:excisionase family DNA binding protein
MKVRQKELAKHFNVSPRTVQRWRNDRILPFYRIGNVILFDLAEADRALAAFKREAL